MFGWLNSGIYPMRRRRCLFRHATPPRWPVVSRHLFVCACNPFSKCIRLLCHARAITDGMQGHAETYLEFNIDHSEITKVSQPPEPSSAPAARAVACIASIGIVAIIDDFGLLFLPMFAPDQAPQVCHRSATLESTL